MPTNQPGSLGDHLVTLGIIAAVTIATLYCATAAPRGWWILALAVSVVLVCWRLREVRRAQEKFQSTRLAARLMSKHGISSDSEHEE